MMKIYFHLKEIPASICKVEKIIWQKKPLEFGIRETYFQKISSMFSSGAKPKRNLHRYYVNADFGANKMLINCVNSRILVNIRWLSM